MASSPVETRLIGMTITWEEPKAATATAVAPGTGAATRVSLGRQAGIIAAAVTAYFLVRGATEAATGRALDNARAVVGFERSVGLFREAWLQAKLTGLTGDTINGGSVVTTLCNWIYIFGHWPVIVATLIWLARGHPAVYYRTRDAMLLSGAVGLVVFALFPLAPPRLAELGLVDTVTAHSDAYRLLQPPMFTNQYAAMPSLHVGWDLLIGLAIAVAARRAWVKAIGLALPVLMLTAVVLTANHYIVDAIAGAALTSGCWLYVRARRRRAVRRGYAGWDGLRLR
jgi:hypothetical protein